VLEYARRDARRIFVGKSKGDHTPPTGDQCAVGDGGEGRLPRRA
jgi:hypothetical protein